MGRKQHRQHLTVCLIQPGQHLKNKPEERHADHHLAQSIGTESDPDSSLVSFPVQRLTNEKNREQERQRVGLKSVFVQHPENVLREDPREDQHRPHQPHSRAPSCSQKSESPTAPPPSFAGHPSQAGEKRSDRTSQKKGSEQELGCGQRNRITVCFDDMNGLTEEGSRCTLRVHSPHAIQVLFQADRKEHLLPRGNRLVAARPDQELESGVVGV